MIKNQHSIVFGIIFLLTSYKNNIIASSSDLFYTGDLPAPYCDLKKVLPFNNHGWYANSEWISRLIKNNSVVQVIEVGSWLGCSTRHIASLLPEHGKVYAVDTWKGSVEHHEDAGCSAILPTLYEQFLSNVVRTGLTKKIIPIQMTSLQAAQEMEKYQFKIDLVYIDAAHDTQSVLQDLEAYFPFVSNHKGILCGDDWWAESVRIAVIDFAQKNELTVYGGENFWFVAEEGKFGVHGFIGASDEIWKFPKVK